MGSARKFEADLDAFCEFIRFDGRPEDLCGEIAKLRKLVEAADAGKKSLHDALVAMISWHDSVTHCAPEIDSPDFIEECRALTNLY